jgi:molecular chaperone DnaK (HSP70)
MSIGIDLGTTHCVVAYSDGNEVSVLPLAQLVAEGEVAARELLPSFIFLAETPFAGEYARKLGAQAPTKLVHSAKSWICHGGINRRAPILPWAAEGAAHVSPFDAQVMLLQHMRAAWERAHPARPISQEDVVVTVPASFDEGARELTLDAAREAGMAHASLLEEPQAAFYDYVAAETLAAETLAAETLAAETLKDEKLLLVVDIGGGTTDLTLVSSRNGTLERIAVGGHLLLGGDNMDAALAREVMARARIEQLDPSEWAALVQSARAAKETLLAKNAPEQAVISLQRRGSKLISGTTSVRLSREDAESLLVDGFFPFGAEEPDKKRAGLTTLGLPYATDAAIPRHVASFLRKHVDAARKAGARIVGGLPRPDGILLNGGVFNGPILVDRFSAVLKQWFGSDVAFLAHRSLDTAVARGAVRYAMAKRGVGKVIAGGTARAYFIGVAGGQALSVVPRGMEEGTTVKLDQVFELQLGRRVSFPLYASTADRVVPAGTVIPPSPDMETLQPLETALHSAQKTDLARVTLSASVSEQGAIDVHLTTVALPPERWRLSFALSPPNPKTAEVAPAANTPLRLNEALREIDRVLSAKSDPSRAKVLRAQMETMLGERGTWTAATCRALSDSLLCASKVSQSAEHELVWLRLIGWCLRPGYGAPGDAERIEQLVERLKAPAFPSKGQWSEVWIVWRRVAGGLDRPTQERIYAETIRGGGSGGEVPALIAALERVQDKEPAGEEIWKRLPNGPFYPIGRLGARVLLVGGDIVPPTAAEAWLVRLLAVDWKKTEGAAFAAAMLARMSGDASRDVSFAMREAVIARLKKAASPARWIEMVSTATRMDDSDASRLLGDALPAGLRLAG